MLYPFSVAYRAITGFRNYMYDKGLKRGITFDLPVIGVGNLSTGGTGKTPMAEYLIQLFLENGISPGLISRGYGRKKTGYYLLDEQANAFNAGDEPYQVKQKFPLIPVAVSEDRVEGITHLLMQKPDTQVIILDDAFQHRKVKPQLMILLTSYGNLYTDDHLLPYGRLREKKENASRADIIIVTKCPNAITGEEKQQIRKKIAPAAHQQLFFSSLEHGKIQKAGQDEFISADKLKGKNLLLFTGIANTQPLLNYLSENGAIVKYLSFPDHHNYNAYTIEKIRKTLQNSGNDTLLLTTEKDFKRLERGRFWEGLQKVPLYFIPVRLQFLLPDDDIFNRYVLNFTNTKIREFHAEQDK